MKRRLTYDNPEKIDIGCKHCTKEGYTGIDHLEFGQKVLWDVREGLPFADNTITDIHCTHFLEHLSDREVEGFFAEVYRVCKDKAVIYITVPHEGEWGAYAHNHLSFWSEARFEGIVKGFIGARVELKEMKKFRQHGYLEIKVDMIVHKGAK